MAASANSDSQRNRDFPSTADTISVQPTLDRISSEALPWRSIIQSRGVFANRQRARRSRRSEEHTSELQSQSNLVCRLLLEKKKIRHDQRSDVSQFSRLAISRHQPTVT